MIRTDYKTEGLNLKRKYDTWYFSMPKMVWFIQCALCKFHKQRIMFKPQFIFHFSTFPNYHSVIPGWFIHKTVLYIYKFEEKFYHFVVNYHTSRKGL